MDDICRLCCSTNFVNNYIFDEENALFLKMSLYLPIKVHKGDRLPQKICDKCSCKVNDLYQFCNESIEVQNRLKSFLSTAQFLVHKTEDLSVSRPNYKSSPFLRSVDQSTQTDCEFSYALKVKSEPSVPLPIIKKEDICFEEHDLFTQSHLHSDNSEEEFLIDIQKKKNERDGTNGDVRAARRRKSSNKIENDVLNILENNSYNVIQEENMDLSVVKEEIDIKPPVFNVGVEASANEEVFICCMCFAQCESRSELLTHYRRHGRKSKATEKPPPPPPPPPPQPPGDMIKCTRCQKSMSPSEWAKHWKRHYARDTRPFRCALCQATYRDHYKLLRHGLAHAPAELRAAAPAAAARFLCDACPQAFVYMRGMLAHRALAHPEAAAAPPALRCAVCARAFAHPNSLRRHARGHSGARDHLCAVCGKALSSREHLKFHLRIHSGHKPHACAVCGKAFAKKCNLKLHERVHSGEKPHVCSHCGKAFSQRSTLVIHERYHNGARPYACALCGRGFVARGLLTMHLKTACVDAPPAHRAAPPPPAPAHRAPPAPAAAPPALDSRR